MCSLEIREYIDRSDPRLFLTVKPSPDTGTNFKDAIGSKLAEYEMESDPAKKQVLQVQLKAGVIAMQQARLGNMVINSQDVDNKESATIHITAESDVELLTARAKSSYVAMTASATYAASAYGSSMIMDDDDSNDDDDFSSFDGDDNSSFSPLRGLGAASWSKVNTKMKAIQNKVFSNQEEVVSETYDSDQLETVVDIMTNYNTIVEDSESWKSWTPDQFFSFIIKRWSDVKNYSKKIRTFAGRAMDSSVSALPVRLEGDVSEGVLHLDVLSQKIDEFERLLKSEMSTEDRYRAMVLESEIEDYFMLSEPIDASVDDVFVDEDMLPLQLSDLEQRLVDDLKVRMEGANRENYVTDSLALTDQWWDKVAEYVPSLGMLLPFMLMADVSTDISKEMDWGNWNGKVDSKIDAFISDQEGGFIDFAMSQYIEYVSTHFLGTYKGQGVVTIEDFKVHNDYDAKAVFSTLVQNGFVDGGGKITDNFDYYNPLQDFGIGLDETENRRIYFILSQALHGDLHFDTLDNTKVNEYDRIGISLITPMGESVTLSELMSKLSEGETPIERYQNTRDVYNVLFDMQSSMTGLTVHDETEALMPQISQNSEGKFEMTIYPKGSWLELATEGDSRFLDEKTDLPVTIQFTSNREAQQFYDHIHQLALALEPIVGTFDPVSGIDSGIMTTYYQDGEGVEGPLRVLIDNVAQLGSDGLVAPGSDAFRYGVDTLYHSSFFETSEWADISASLRSRVSRKIGEDLFQQSIGNKVRKFRHQRRSEEYQKGKAEHIDNEIDRIRKEYKQRAKRRAEYRRQLNRAARAAKKRRKGR